MPRYKLKIEYDGTNFVGWQQQDNGPSVQMAIQTAAFHFCGSEVDCLAAGRTDSGVHALGQVAHLDFPSSYPTDTVRDALNSYLRPSAISILDAELVPDDFHARFSATKRTYLYVIINRRSPLTLERDRAWLIPRVLNHKTMQEGSRYLLGRHDFTSFRATECQANSPIKTLDRIDISRHGDTINITVEARSFLHRQVRNIVGTLVLVGEGKFQPNEVGVILRAKDRSVAGPCAPAEGLYLTAVAYG